MENLVKVTNESKLNSKICLDNRCKLNITGVTKVVSANDSLVALVIDKEKLSVSGSELQVNKFDVERGELEVVGTINDIKYVSGGNIIKRFFK